MHVWRSKSSKSVAISGVAMVDSTRLAEGTSWLSRWDKTRRLNSDAKLVLWASKLALDNAQLNFKMADRTRIGIVLGCNFGSYGSYETFYESIKNSNVQPQAFTNSLANIPAAAVSIFWGIKGPCITFCNSMHPSMEVTKWALNLIDNDVCDVVLAGWWQKMSKTLAHCLTANNCLSCTEDIAVLTVIETLEYAKNRKACSYLLFP